MVTEATDKIKTLETRMTDIEKKQDYTLDSLNLIKEQLKKLDTIELGLFGNEKIEYKGVIKTQIDLQDKIRLLEEKIAEIEKINGEQDIAIQAKKGLKGEWIGWGKQILQVAVNMLMFYLLYKGIIGPDALLHF